MTNLVNQPGPQPTRKITAVALGGAIATVLAWAVEELAGVTVPAAVVAAFTTLFAFGLGYVVKERA